MAVRHSVTVLIVPTLVYAGAAAASFPQTYWPLLSGYFEQLLYLPIALALVLPLIAIAYAPSAPMSYVFALIRQRGKYLIPVFVLYTIGMTGFTTFKIYLPQIIPFYADAVFADIDELLHFGNPGEWAHALVPQWAQHALAFLYGPVWFISWFGLIAFVTLQPRQVLRAQYLWTLALAICLLGTLAATAFASVGPIFYAEFVQSDRFDLLLASIHASAAGAYMQESAGYLLSHYHAGSDGLGTGISAMPSMHLAVVTLNAWALSTINKVWSVIGWFYVALILLGSVYLGWHYAIDGYVSIIAVSLLWWIVSKTLAQLPALTRTS